MTAKILPQKILLYDYKYQSENPQLKHIAHSNNG